MAAERGRQVQGAVTQLDGTSSDRVAVATIRCAIVGEQVRMLEDSDAQGVNQHIEQRSLGDVDERGRAMVLDPSAQAPHGAHRRRHSQPLRNVYLH
jgi:hypothetical protein